MNKFSTKLKTSLVKFLINMLAMLSLKNCHRFGTLIGKLLYLSAGKSRKVTTTNIQLCFPLMSATEQDKLVRQTLVETGKTLAEAGPMWLWKKEKLFALIKNVHGEEAIHESLKNNKGVIIALPHLGNWELLGLYCSAKYPTTSLYRVPRMSQLDSIVKTGRERLGAKLVPTDSKGIRSLYKALQSHEVTCILPDQEPSMEKGSGVFAAFFGIQTYSMTLLSRLEQKTGATIIIGYTKRLPNGTGYEIFFNELSHHSLLKNDTVTLAESVTRLNMGLEKCIREIPEQYQWGYKRFRTRPEGEKEIY